MPIHEIISSAELEQLLKEAARKKEQGKEQPAIEESIVRAKDSAGIQTILEALTTDELKVYAASNLLTGKISVNGDILASLVRATEDTLELFRKMRESGSEIGTPTTPLSKAWSELQALKSRRKGLQQELHKLWLKRRAVMKAQRTAKISREEYETLGEMWEHASVENYRGCSRITGKCAVRCLKGGVSMKRFLLDVKRALAILLMPELEEARMRRKELSRRLHSIFSIDAIEGQLDLAVRIGLK